MGRRQGGRAFITFGYHRRPPARTRAGLRGPAPGLLIKGKNNMLFYYFFFQISFFLNLICISEKSDLLKKINFSYIY